MSTMKAKDYKVVAGVLKDVHDDQPDDVDRATVRDVAQRLARRFRDNNPRFDGERFLQACGVKVEAPFCKKCGVWHHGDHIKFS